MRKGQLFSLDLMIGVTMGVAILAIVLAFWAISSGNLNSQQDKIDMQRAAFDASNKLVLETLGAENVIDSDKLTIVLASNYTDVKQTLGLEGFDFYLTLKDTSGSLIASFGEETSQAKNIVLARRVVLLENEELILKLAVWN